MKQSPVTGARWQVALGFAGAALATYTDLALRYTPNVAAESALRGHVLGIVGILLQIVGFWGISTALGGGEFWPRAFRWITTSSYGLAAFAEAARTSQTALAILLLPGFLAGMALFVWRVERVGARFPPAMAAASQLGFPVVAVTALWLPPSARSVLLPSGISFCSSLFFACTLLSFVRDEPSPPASVSLPGHRQGAA